MHAQLELAVEDPSQVGHARREAARLARQFNLPEHRISDLELIAAEAASNLIRHTAGGRILLRPLQSDRQLGLEVLALDRGPGIRNLAECMRDGYSTAGGLGGGLGAMQRLSSQFDLYSLPDKGTVVRCVLWSDADAENPVRDATSWGAVCVAKPGEDVSGDAWLVEPYDAGHLVAVVDGLGHGPQAATAATGAMRSISAEAGLDGRASAPRGANLPGPAELVRRTHDAIRSTRGAALAVGQLDGVNDSATVAGVGNIGACVVDNGRNRHLISHHGIVGHEMRKVQEFTTAWPPGALLVMHSDGVSANWDIDSYPRLTLQHPSVIAAVLYRDFCSRRDDATVVVVKRPPRNGGDVNVRGQLA